jgi:hypothetical protein
VKRFLYKCENSSLDVWKDALVSFLVAFLSFYPCVYVFQPPLFSPTRFVYHVVFMFRYVWEVGARYEAIALAPGAPG